jgi:uncharacterized protein (TIGR03067 family)
MKPVIFLYMMIISLGCSSTKNAACKPEKLNGIWVPVKQEMGGTLLPTEGLENQQLILSDSTYTVIAESVDKGIVKYKEDKIDIYGKDGVNAGKHFTAIYKFEKEQLTICYNLKGDTYPVDFETKDKPLFFLSVFRKEKGK